MLTQKQEWIQIQMELRELLQQTLEALTPTGSIFFIKQAQAVKVIVQGFRSTKSSGSNEPGSFVTFFITYAPLARLSRKSELMFIRRKLERIDCKHRFVFASRLTISFTFSTSHRVASILGS